MPLFGVPVQREWVDIETIEGFLVTEWPSIVVELGTGTGAFSLYLACYCASHGFRFYTYDTGENTHMHSRPHNPCLDAVKSIGGVVRKADVFSGDTIEEIASLSPSFIYCDNGDKIRELQTYAPLVPVGSFIGVHDYGHEITDIALPGFKVWREDSFENSTNRILERVE